MKAVLSVLLLVQGFFVVNFYGNDNLLWPDFDTSLAKEVKLHNKFQKCSYAFNFGIDGRFLNAHKCYTVLKELFDRNIKYVFYPYIAHKNTRYIVQKKRFQPNLSPIPPIIHQIWIGPPMPDKYKKYAKTFVDKNPQFTYRLWTEAKLKDIQFINKDLIKSAALLVDKVDLIRYELLYQFGGIYVDIDMECLRPLDVLAKQYDFFACIAPLSSGCFIINNAIIGASRQHPFLKKLIAAAKLHLECLKLMRQKYGSGLPVFAGTLFTRAFVDYLATPDASLNHMIIFPPSYFYPSNRVEPESFVIHYWDASWLNR